MEDQTQERIIEEKRAQLLTICLETQSIASKFIADKETRLQTIYVQLTAQKISLSDLKQCQSTLETIVESINPIKDNKCGCRQYNRKLHHAPTPFREQRIQAHLTLEALLKSYRELDEQKNTGH